VLGFDNRLINVLHVPQNFLTFITKETTDWKQFSYYVNEKKISKKRRFMFTTSSAHNGKVMVKFILSAPWLE